MNTRLTLMLSLLLSATAPAFAQSHGNHAAHGNTPASKALDASTQLTEEHFDTLDKDKDGFVSKSELPEGHPLADHFSMADRNRDGKLDSREFKVLIRMQ